MISIQNTSDFERFFKGNYEALCHYALSYLNDRDEAEEIVQNCFVKLWEGRKKISPEVSLKAYIYKMVRNAALNVITHEEVKRKYEAFSKLQLHVEEEEKDNGEYLKQRIEAAIAEMPEKRKEILLLSRYEGLSYQEIAEDLNISVKTVENHMGAALKQLRVALKDLSHYLFIIFFIDGLGECISSLVI